MDDIRGRRQWRGIEATARDFLFWLSIWKTMLDFLMPGPLRMLKELKKYDMLRDYISIPALADEYTGKSRGDSLRKKHDEISESVKAVLKNVRIVLLAERYSSEKTVWVEGKSAALIMRGFPKLKEVSAPLVTAAFSDRCTKLPCCGSCSVICHTMGKAVLPPPVFVLTGERLVECIHFVEAETGEKFDWDTFAESIRDSSGQERDISAVLEAVNRNL